jgi:hypothetical protein
MERLADIVAPCEVSRDLLCVQPRCLSRTPGAKYDFGLQHFPVGCDHAHTLADLARTTHWTEADFARAAADAAQRAAGHSLGARHARLSPG